MDKSIDNTIYDNTQRDTVDAQLAAQPYTLQVNGTTVRAYFSGTAGLGSRLADVFGSISKNGNTMSSIP
jgi:hypothetical protein